MKVYNHGKTRLAVYDNGAFDIGYDGFDFDTAQSQSGIGFEINVCGGNRLDLNGGGFEIESINEEKDKLELTYISKKYALQAVVTLEFAEGTSLIVQTNKVTNIGDSDIKLTRFSSSIVRSIALDKNLPWYENDDLRIYVCHNKWQAEGQWQAFKPYELGLVPATTHDWERESFRLISNGSWSTSDFFPLAVIDDPIHNASWFMEIEGSHNWMIKYTTFGGYVKPNLILEATGADENYGDWFKVITPGESYTSERAFIGVADSGMENAARQLIKFKRADTTAYYENNIVPAVFNVYMDCIWGSPTPQNLLPLIDAASDAGCEYFIIDGGWSTNEYGDGLGDWMPKQFYEGNYTLPKLAEQIKAKGMIPGIWLELEACSGDAYGYKLDEDCLLTRHGKNVRGDRSFYNFKNEKVKKYLFDKVQELYDMGYRYIKNDYNNSTGAGAHNIGNGSAAEGNVENANAFYEFVDTLRKAFPDLIIENCGSGALRDDNKMLRRCHVQSTSDQELYRHNVSITQGTLMFTAPEKAGTWAYPYPALFDVRETFSATEEYKKKMADGRETVFNMVCTMPVARFMSGRIDTMDDKNFQLVKEGIEIFKDIREFIPESYPIYPNGFCRINQKCNTSFGLLSDKRLLLCVFNIGCDETSFKVDVTKYANNGKVIRQYFADGTVDYTYENGVFNINFDAPDTAAFFEIEL